jgi:ketosteroid isomerase-like protein
MSQENVETVRSMFEPLARGDFRRWFDEVTDDFVFVTSPTDLPDAGTYRGEAARDWIMAWVESFEGHTNEASDFIDGGDKVFLATFQRGRPRGDLSYGDRAFPERHHDPPLTIHRDLASDERDQALEAAGLRE